MLEHRRAKRRPHRALQRARRLLRVPPWADLGAIALLYREAGRLTASTGIPHEVDHVVPLLGTTVSGLHVETNLRVVTKVTNRLKSNRFDEWMVGGAGFEPATPAV